MDPADYIFKPGWLGFAGSTGSVVSTETTNNAVRSPLVVLLNGINTTDTYRIEVVYSVEYIPTSSFTAWTETVSSPLTTESIRSFSKNIMNEIAPAISGLIGRKIAGSGSIG